MSEPIRFVATLAGANTNAKCLSVGADGDAKLVLEVDSTQLAAVLTLLTRKGETFTVTVE